MSFIDNLKKYAKQRSREVRELAHSDLTLSAVEAGLGGPTLKFLANVERRAAWELYVELSTRIATQELGAQDGLVREAFSSLYSLFAITRDILKRAGPGVAMSEESLGRYAMAVLNRCIRPLLAKWHPLLAQWEARRDPDTSHVEHERAWEHIDEVRADLGNVRAVLSGYAEALELLSGITPSQEPTSSA